MMQRAMRKQRRPRGATQASAFNESCPIYAPDYWQAHLVRFFCNKVEGRIAIDFAYFAIEKGKGMPIFLNAANEVAVNHFLKDN